MKKKYISQNPEIMGGKPVITGTRIPLSRIIFLLEDGYTLESIQMEYPHVNIDKIKGAIEELRQNLDTHCYAA